MRRRAAVELLLWRRSLPKNPREQCQVHGVHQAVEATKETREGPQACCITLILVWVSELHEPDVRLLSIWTLPSTGFHNLSIPAW